MHIQNENKKNRMSGINKKFQKSIESLYYNETCKSPYIKNFNNDKNRKQIKFNKLKSGKKD